MCFHDETKTRVGNQLGHGLFAKLFSENGIDSSSFLSHLRERFGRFRQSPAPVDQPATGPVTGSTPGAKSPLGNMMDRFYSPSRTTDVQRR